MKRAAKHLARRLRRAVQRSPSKPDVHPDVNPLYAHRCHAGRTDRWQPVPSVSAHGEASGLADGIFQPPGFVSVDGTVFDLRAEGVYRFYRLPRLAEQRIVWHGTLDSLLNMLGYLWAYGLVDDSIEPDDALVLVRNRVVVAGCNNLARIVAKLLTLAGFAARRVALASLDPWGGQDDGHTLVEVWPEEGRWSSWLLYDPSFNVCFMENGRRLSLVDAVDGFRNRRVTLSRLPGNFRHGTYRTADFDYCFWVSERRDSDEMLYDWYCRIAGVPLILDDGKYAFCASGLAGRDRERLTRRYRMMHRDEFLNRFYSRQVNQES